MILGVVVVVVFAPTPKLNSMRRNASRIVLPTGLISQKNPVDVPLCALTWTDCSAVLNL